MRGHDGTGAAAATTPARGPRLWRRLSPRTRTGVRIGLAVVAILCATLGGLVAYAAFTLPDVNTIGQATGTVKVLDRNGQLVGEYGAGGQQRTTVTIDKVAPVLQDATIATEDRGFYNEGAINFGRVAKALFVDAIARHPSQGASTITQQLAKLAFFGGNADKSPLRKLREALLANEIDRMYSKQQILEKYLNLINYGHGAYGIQDASQTYFGKDAKDLTLVEASLLAGIPNAPADYDPFENASNAFARQHVVLASMVADGKATQDQADAVDPTTGSADQQQQKQAAIQGELKKGHRTAKAQVAPHFVEYVREQVNQLFADDPAALNGNITVKTTLDLRIQTKAQTAVTNGVAKLQSSDANNGAMLMMDSSNGDILAMVGSADFNNDSIAGQYNVTTGARRPGSSFKPYVYETGFIDGAIKPDTILDDTAQQSQKYGGVHDFDGKFLGRITAAKSLLESRNVSTEQAADKAGLGNVVTFAHALGITTPLDDTSLTTAIGTSAVRMIDHTAAYSAFSNGGYKVTPRSILSVTDDSGGSLYDAGKGGVGQQVMTAQQSYAITKILLGYAQRWGLGFKHQTAGKSGTTDNFVDAWYMTYTPNFVVATWAGHTDQTGAEIGMKNVFGTSVGSAISVPFVNSLTNEVPFNSFKPVSGALSDCASADATISGIDRGGCPTPTPTPSPTPSPTPTPTASSSSTSTDTGGVTVTVPPIVGSPTPSPAPSPSPTPTPSPSPQAAASSGSTAAGGAPPSP